MKNRLLLFLIIFLPVTGCKDNSIQISGKLENPVSGGFLYLDELKATSLERIDSFKLASDGRFSFEREIETPTFFLLKTNNNNFLMMLADPGSNIRISGDYSNLGEPQSVEGSEGTAQMQQYNKALKGTIAKLNGLNEVYEQNTDSPNLPGVIQTLDSTARAYFREINDYTKKYIDRNLKSMVSLIALYQQISPQAYVMNPVDDIEYFLKVDSSLFSMYPESEPVKELHRQVESLVRSVSLENGKMAILKNGNEAPDISLPSPSGEVISLSSTRGKIVLLDFWAAWCGPCRRENPKLVEAYRKYRDKGFEIYQVSLDKTKEEWVKGIEQDKLGQWIHVSDLKYWNSSVVAQYKIESIPNNYLLDREGRIIASNLRGENLLTTLEEVFK